jgi:hypothetical protein
MAVRSAEESPPTAVLHPVQQEGVFNQGTITNGHANDSEKQRAQGVKTGSNHKNSAANVNISGKSPARGLTEDQPPAETDRLGPTATSTGAGPGDTDAVNGSRSTSRTVSNIFFHVKNHHLSE